MARFRLGDAAAVIAAAGLMLAAAPVSAGNVTCKYDDQHRLVEVDYADGWTVTYTYDAKGKRTRTAHHEKKTH